VHVALLYFISFLSLALQIHIENDSDGTWLVIVYVGAVGTHLAAVMIWNPQKLVGWAKGVLVIAWIWAIAVMLPKLSILGFYLRFFKSNTERYITYAIMGLLVVTSIVNGLVTTFDCTPIAYQWDKSIQGRCIDVLALYRWMSFPNIVTDVIILVLPMRMVWALRMTRTQKLGLSVIFLTGGV
jgi:hypothetical protein